MLFVKGLIAGAIVMSLGIGILLAICLPHWALVVIETFLIIFLGLLLIKGR